MSISIALSLSPASPAPEDIPPALLPEVFGANDWVATSAPGGDALEVTIFAIPASQGSPVSDIAYALDGGDWISSGRIDGFSIADIAPGLYDLRLRAVNAAGPGAPSDIKSVLVTGAGPVPMLVSDSFDGATQTWQITTDQQNDGSYVWARVAQTAADPVPDGAGGWSSPVKESGSFAVSTNGTAYDIPETGAPGQPYKLALYQRTEAGRDSNMLIQSYTAAGTVPDTVAVATPSSLVLAPQGSAAGTAAVTTAGYTCAGGAQNCLVLSAAILCNGSAGIIDFATTTVSFGGQTCTVIGVTPSHTTMLGANLVAYLMNPPATAATTASLHFRDSVGADLGVRAIAVSMVELTGVSATAPVGASAPHVTTGTQPIDTDITPAHSGSWVVAVAATPRVTGPALTPTADTVADHTGTTGSLNFSDVTYLMGHADIDAAGARTMGAAEARSNASALAVEFRPA